MSFTPPPLVVTAHEASWLGEDFTYWRVCKDHGDGSVSQWAVTTDEVRGKLKRRVRERTWSGKLLDPKGTLTERVLAAVAEFEAGA